MQQRSVFCVCVCVGILVATLRLCVGSGLIRQCLKCPLMDQLLRDSAAGPKGSQLIRAHPKTSPRCPSLLGRTEQ